MKEDEDGLVVAEQRCCETRGEQVGERRNQAEKSRGDHGVEQRGGGWRRREEKTLGQEEQEMRRQSGHEFLNSMQQRRASRRRLSESKREKRA